MRTLQSAVHGTTGVPAVSATGIMQRARGEGRLRTKERDGRTCLDVFFQEGAAKIRLPRPHGSALEAVLINTAGGLTGGDHIQWTVEAAPRTTLVATTQACERVYRTTGDDARVLTRIRIGAGAHVDWLPQETILFENSRLDRSLEVHLAEGANFTAVEAILLGREAMGEDALNACLSDRWRIYRHGRLLHAEATRLTGCEGERFGPALLAGNRAFATIVAIAPDAEHKVDALRALIAPDAFAAASAIGERLTLRALAPSGLALRRILAPAIALLSGAGTLPRLWTI